MHIQRSGASLFAIYAVIWNHGCLSHSLCSLNFVVLIRHDFRLIRNTREFEVS